MKRSDMFKMNTREGYNAWIEWCIAMITMAYLEVGESWNLPDGRKLFFISHEENSIYATIRKNVKHSGIRMIRRLNPEMELEG